MACASTPVRECLDKVSTPRGRRPQTLVVQLLCSMRLDTRTYHVTRAGNSQCKLACCVLLTTVVVLRSFLECFFLCAQICTRVASTKILLNGNEHILIVCSVFCDSLCAIDSYAIPLAGVRKIFFPNTPGKYGPRLLKYRVQSKTPRGKPTTWLDKSRAS